MVFVLLREAVIEEIGRLDQVIVDRDDHVIPPPRLWVGMQRRRHAGNRTAKGSHRTSCEVSGWYPFVHRARSRPGKRPSLRLLWEFLPARRTGREPPGGSAEPTRPRPGR